MKLFVTDSDMPALEAAAASASKQRRSLHVVELAWHLRQRDPQRAKTLVTEIEPMLSGLESRLHDQTVARIELLRAELCIGSGEIAAALTHAQNAQAAFKTLEDRVGFSDTAFTLSAIANEHGAREEVSAALEEAALQARIVGDETRADTFEASRAALECYAGSQPAEARWGEFIATALRHADRAVQAWAHEFLAAAAFERGEVRDCVEFYIKVIEDFRQTGQLRRSIVCACNLAASLSNINDHAGALEWLSDALEVARRMEAPRSIGACLIQTAHTLSELGKASAAREHILDAQRTLSNLPPNRSHAILLQVLGDTHLAMGEGEKALAYYKEQGEFAILRLGLLHQVIALRGQVEALSALDRPKDALDVAQSALALVRLQGNSLVESELLEAVAMIHLRHQLPAPEGSPWRNAGLHYLHMALDATKAVANAAPRSRLLRSLAEQHAQAGEFQLAYEYSDQASRAHEREQSESTTQRALALDVRHQLQQARALVEHHTELAKAEARRAEALASNSDTLLRLSVMGQEITAQLDLSHVLLALNRNVQGLLDASTFMVFLLDAKQSGLRCVFGVEDGQAVPSFTIPLNELDSPVAECARTGLDILREREATDDSTQPADKGTSPPLSALFAPLLVAGRQVGVITLQSRRMHAYAERERMILRALCAYGAIALENARVYGALQGALDALRDAQTTLVRQNEALEGANANLVEASATDSLTGLRNRRSLLQHLPGDVALALRSFERAAKEPPTDADLTFFLIDLDNFKSVNDERGHAAGDAVLSALRARLRSVCRDTDYLVRWGGEEFLVVARQSDRRSAAELAERLRIAIADKPFEVEGGQVNMTASIGFACFPFDPASPKSCSWEKVVDFADQALYRAKAAGRNTWRGLTHPVASKAAGHAEVQPVIWKPNGAVV
jgi:diguanylate cyclase (GGDEF)-like protein